MPVDHADAAPAVDARILDAITAGAVVAFSISGGKDGTAAMHAVMKLLDDLGHPRADRVAIHADLGRAEWKSTPRIVEDLAGHFDLPLMVVRHGKHDMVSRWEARFAEGKRRYADLEVFNLIGPWSSASLRFCTAELKQQVISPALARTFPGRTIISVLGIRREESVGRRNRPISQDEPRWAKRDGTRLMSWCPGVEWSTASVFARHREFGLPLHEAYTAYGCSRVSCAFCVLQSLPDQLAAVRAPGNRGLLLDLVDLEARSTYSFQQGRWLGDLAPHLLPPDLVRAIGEAKAKSDERSKLEAALPAGLRYVKGWPVRLPTMDEAIQVVAAREVILRHHDLPIKYPTARSVIDRFAELMSLQSSKAA